MTTPRLLIGLILSFALIGCGGGGATGGSGPINSAVIAITETNQKSVAAAATDSDLRNFGGTGSDQVVAATNATGKPQRINFLKIAQVNLTQAAPQATATPLPAGAVPDSVTRQCVEGDSTSGTVAVNYIDSDGDNDVSNGDSVAITYTNCLDPVTNNRTNGTVSYAITRVTGTPSATTTGWSITASVVFQDLRVTSNNGTGPTSTANGRFTLTFSQDTANQTTSIVIGSTLSVRDNTGTVTWTDFSFTFVENDLTGEYRESGSGTIANTALGGRVTINFTNVSGVDPGFPSAGSIKITGDKSSLTLRPQDSTNVRLELDLGDNGSIDATDTVAWSSLV